MKICHTSLLISSSNGNIFKLFSQSAESGTNLDDEEDGETPFEDNEGNIPSELQLFSTKKEDSPQLKDMVTHQH